MAPQQNVALRPLTTDECSSLERTTKAQSERVDQVRRAQALLAVAQGQPFAQAARQAGFRSGTTLANLVGLHLPPCASLPDIELAYRLAEAAGIPVWCQDEAGHYGTVPSSGASWVRQGQPARLPHEYTRNGTAKLLTLFRPATGEVRAKGVRTATNAILHPWLQSELSAILASLPEMTLAQEARPALAQWETWLGRPPRSVLPPLRLILI